MEAYPNWDLPTLTGAGTLRSTANISDYGMGIGWGIMKSGDNELIWHNGATGGYQSFIGYLPKMNVDIVALSNARTDASVDDIAQHLLNPKAPLAFPSISMPQEPDSADR